MKRILLSFIMSAAALAASAAGDVITLDLTKSTTKLEFDKNNGAWTATFDDDMESIDSQVFSFVHNSMGAYKTWWGFTASNSVDNARKDDTLTYQFSNMALGGIALNEDGTVKTDKYGAPVSSADVPYIVAYASSSFAKHPASVVFSDGKNYKAVGVYVNLNSYAYYSIECGDSFARAFTNGDKFTLTIHGVAPDETEKTVEVNLASYTNGDLSITRGWKYVDLSSLGVVNEIYFSLKSTDSGTYGDNTPSYFCLDKLMVSPAAESGVNAIIDGSAAKISYDRSSKMVNVTGADFAAVYDTAGNMVMSSEESSFSISTLSAGIYVVKAGNSKLKIAK